MSDLTDEEIEATRRFYGVDKMSFKRAKTELQEYIDEDYIYQSYLDRKPNAVKSDFDEFCVNHCEAIDVVLQKLDELEERNKYLVNYRTKLEKELFESNENYIKKEKIRQKIEKYNGLKEIDQSAYEQQVKPLQELLEEG